MIELLDVSVKPISFEEAANQPDLIKDLRLRIAKGEWITVIGRNGSGKSTLAKLLAGYKAGLMKGKIIRNAEAIGDASQEIPIVMQQPDASMVGATPWEDVIMMLEQHGTKEDQIIERAEQALERTGMSARAHQAVGTLSGGQKQLTAVAGCLALHAPMLVLDEATAMLDPEASMFVLQRVRELHQTGVTVIWITQKLTEIGSTDRVLALEHGEKVFDGAAEQFYERGYKDGKNGNAARPSVCEQLGMEAPYVVQTAWELEKLGLRMDHMPMSPEMLVKAVQAL